jgi:CMP-N-acetylneuraminic acid synthetase
MKNTAVVIPIKTNNQRLPGKNTMMLGDRPLYDYLFKTVKSCEKVNSIYVDSSDEEILDIALSEGFNVIKRPVSLNSPETSGNDLLRFEMKHIPEHIICQCFVTLPFLRSQTIDTSIELLIEARVSSILALSKVENRFWYQGAPINHDYKTLQGTQYESPVYVEAGFYTFKKREFLLEESRITDSRAIMYVDEIECIDIDTKFDFAYAEALVKSGLVL